jgi:hypothetical protein
VNYIPNRALAAHLVARTFSTHVALIASVDALNVALVLGLCRESLSYVADPNAALTRLSIMAGNCIVKSHIVLRILGGSLMITTHGSAHVALAVRDSERSGNARR